MSSALGTNSTEKMEKTSEKRMYSMVDMHGYGRLVLLMRYYPILLKILFSRRKATASGDYSHLESVINSEVREMTYSHGKGKLLPISELVQIRNEVGNRTSVVKEQWLGTKFYSGSLFEEKGKGKTWSECSGTRGYSKCWRYAQRFLKKKYTRNYFQR